MCWAASCSARLARHSSPKAVIAAVPNRLLIHSLKPIDFAYC